MKRIIIFGAGNTGIRAYEQYNTEFHTLCFLDNDKEKWGKQLKGISIIQPTKENISLYLYDYIIIASASGKREIVKQLTDWGVEPHKIQYLKGNPDVLSPFLKNLSEVYYNEDVIGAVAEVGVFQGESAEKINSYFKTKRMHLFDTFSGFVQKDVNVELENSFSTAKEFQYNDTSVEMVMNRMHYPENVVIHKGDFSDTAPEVNEFFCFVRIDVDLYAPTVAALDFFHPLMARNGCILVHDYFGESYKGIKKAIDEYFEKYPKLFKIPIGDSLSIAIVGY